MENVTRLNVIHFADSHIGVRRYGRVNAKSGIHSRVADYLDRLDEVKDAVLRLAKNDPATPLLVIFAGDAFDNNHPDTDAIARFTQRIFAMMASGAFVLLLEGNHDIHPHPNRHSPLALVASIAGAGARGEVRLVTAPSSFQWQIASPDRSTSTSLFIGAIPYPSPRRWLSSAELSHRSKTEVAYETVKRVVEQIAAMETEAMKSGSEACIFVGHFSLRAGDEDGNGGLALSLGSGGGGERLSASEPTVPLQAFNPAVWDYIALGHIHAGQAWICRAKDSTSSPVSSSLHCRAVDFSDFRLGRNGECNRRKGEAFVIGEIRRLSASRATAAEATAGTIIAYPGSLAISTFGEEGQAKGYIIVRKREDAVSAAYCPTHHRPFYTVRLDLGLVLYAAGEGGAAEGTNEAVTGTGILSPSLVAQSIRDEVIRRLEEEGGEGKRLRGSVLRLILTMTNEQRAYVDESLIADGLRKAGAHWVQVNYDVIRRRPLRLRAVLDTLEEDDETNTKTEEIMDEEDNDGRSNEGDEAMDSLRLITGVSDDKLFRAYVKLKLEDGQVADAVLERAEAIALHYLEANGGG